MDPANVSQFDAREPIVPISLDGGTSHPIVGVVSELDAEAGEVGVGIGVVVVAKIPILGVVESDSIAGEVFLVAGDGPVLRDGEIGEGSINDLRVRTSSWYATQIGVGILNLN